jgi:hypothetical protein
MNKEGRTDEEATMNLRTNRKRPRRPRTHARTLRQKMIEEPPQEKDFFFLFHKFQLERKLYAGKDQEDLAHTPLKREMIEEQPQEKESFLIFH